MSEEQVHRRQLRAKKRREKAAEKNEKDKATNFLHAVVIVLLSLARTHCRYCDSVIIINVQNIS